MQICGRINREALPASKGPLYPEAPPDRGLFCNFGRVFWSGSEDRSAQTGRRTQKAKRAMVTLDTFSNREEILGSEVQSAFKRIRSWCVPPNWSRSNWIEELTAVGTAAAWQAVREFNPEQGVRLAAFGYCRILTRCLARYRKEWRYALPLVASDSYEEKATTLKDPGLAVSSAAKVNRTDRSNDLRVAIAALPAEQRRLIEQLFWEERTEIEVADAMGVHQSTVNRRKRAILNSLRMKLRDQNEFQRFSA
jgi:RNA polymerase sigma factor (sigma-70 family)